MIILAMVSLITYSGVLIPPGTKAAFIFLVAPLLSWLFIAIFFLVARKNLRKSTKHLIP
jgi:hypothetical protein